jgi:thiol-disulfide isomerase/thioredoxin
MLRRASWLLSLALAGCGGAASAPAAFRVEPGGVEAVEAALDGQRGQGCLLNVWATWCPPCVAELPELIEVARAYEARGGRVLGVSHDRMFAKVEQDAVAEMVRSFLRERDLPLPTVLLDEGAVERLDERFELPGFIPVTLAFDRDGKVVDRHEGEASRERFEEMMRKALGL